jgi:predicted nucleic acid-binding protein
MIVYLDTNVVIYATENPPVWGPKATGRLAALRAAGHDFMVSDLTRMECLVGPLKSGNGTLENQFRAFFTSSGVQVTAITPGLCDRAARVRASFGFKPMDALQLAAAVEHGAHVFLTNDLRLQAFTGITVEVLT